MHDPYKLTGPTCLSFSGGRTSAYMLFMVLTHNTAEDIARWLVVCFANTGLEDEATLRFVRDCATHWGVQIRWVEYRDEAPGFAVVDFDTASRDGEPFEAIVRKRNFLPNPVTRFCTSELKIRTMHKFLRANWQALGWDAEDLEWDQMIGIRADEHRRASKIRARGHSTETTKEQMLIPLADAGVTLAHIDAFWKAQPFRLELFTDAKGRTLGGNCTLCFLKPELQVRSLIAANPAVAVPWVRMEKFAEDNFATKNSGGSWRFRVDRASYAQLAANVRDQGDLYGHEDEEALACFCGE